jgi:hypothetical protein
MEMNILKILIQSATPELNLQQDFASCNNSTTRFTTFKTKKKKKKSKIVLKDCVHVCVCVCVCVCTELGIALVPYSPLGHGSFAGYKPGAEHQESHNVCNLFSSNFPTLLSSA